MYEYEIKHNQYLRENSAECTLFLRRNEQFPISEAGKVALYGSGARNTLKGGTGSGEVNSRFYVTIEEGLKQAGFTITTTDWLDAYDKVIAEAKEAFYEGIRKEAAERNCPAFHFGMGRILPEPEYTIPMEGEGDLGIYVLSRICGEGSDRNPVAGEIKLSQTEIRDILFCNAKYEHFMLVLNVGGAVDVSPLTEVKNILVLSQLGVETGEVFTDILLGKSNPSGKLSTTWASFEEYPFYEDFGQKNDTRYREGIYVGYRYFDTVGKKALFPFGYGLSYTDFSVTPAGVKLEGEVVTVEATVSNIGGVSGKEAVQLYVSVPDGRLDQPYQVLAAFSKTKKLLPGEQETVYVSFRMSDIASYCSEATAYVLEAGDYVLRVGNSSVDTSVAGVVRVTDEITTIKVRSIIPTPDFTDFKPEKVAMTVPENVPVVILPKNAVNERVVTYDVDYPVSDLVKSLPEDELIRLCIGAFHVDGGQASIIGNAAFTVPGAAGQTSIEARKYGIPSIITADGPAGLRLTRTYAKDVDGNVHGLEQSLPESFEALMTEEELAFFQDGAYTAKETDEIYEQYATAIPIGTAIAQSFNTEFAMTCGDMVGEEMEMFGVHLWLAPALNIHRSIRCGRNFEYYSEDPLVSGLMAAAITNGVQKHKGCGTTIKHYAGNNQEYNRVQNNSVMSERTLREIYLKGFGLCVRESQPKAVMTSYNLINGTHTAEHRGLIEDMLRREYEYKNIVMTDWVVGESSNEPGCIYRNSRAPQVMMAGGDLFMPGMMRDFNQVKEALAEGTVTREQLEINGTRLSAMAFELCGPLK